MAHSLSAQKRVRQSVKRQQRNRLRKKTVKIQLKKLNTLVANKDVPGGETALRETIRLMDRLANKGTLHRRTVARRKSRLMRTMNALKAAPAKEAAAPAGE